MILNIDKGKNKLVIKEIDKYEFSLLQRELTRKIKNWRFDIRVKRKIWDGNVSYIYTNEIPLGLWNEARKVCSQVGTKFIIENINEYPLFNNINEKEIEEFYIWFFQSHLTKDQLNKFYPYDYQIESIKKILKYNYCCIEVGTGGGKTLISSMLIFYLLNKHPEFKILIIVPSTSLVRQFYNDIIDYNEGYHQENKNFINFLKVEEIMSESPRRVKKGEEPNLYIATRQSLANFEDIDFFKNIDVVIIDEAHEAVNAVKKIVEKTFKTSKYRIGMSGTLPDEKSLDWLTLQTITGPKVNVIKNKDLKEKKVIAPVDIKIIILNHNNREFHENILKFKNHGKGDKAYIIEKDYIQKSEKRHRFIKELVEKFTKNSLLLFHNEIHGLFIEEFLIKNLDENKFKIHFINGNRELVSLQERLEKQEEVEYNKDFVHILVASYGTLSTGVSIKNIHHIVFLDSFKSLYRIVQSIGRGVRLHELKDQIRIWDLVDIFIPDEDELFKYENKNIFYGHYEQRKKIYKEQSHCYKIMKYNL